jgi:hypothetical protein
MHWAISTAPRGEDPMQILARAQLYEDYLSGFQATVPNLK